MTALHRTRSVECGAPANHRMVCPLHEADYGDTVFSDDVDPASRKPCSCPPCRSDMANIVPCEVRRD